MTCNAGRLCVGAAFVAVALSGCSLPELPNWFGSDDPQVSAVGNGQASANGGRTAALAGASGRSDGMIVDAESNCGTSNPFPQPDERIRWYGACADGKLSGNGTLVWYRGQRETERNEGNFVAGELHGEAITTYPDGRYIVGNYVDGQRDGPFVIHVGDGQHLQAVYSAGRLESQEELSEQQVAAWRERRAAGAPMQVAEARPEPARQPVTQPAARTGPAPAAAPDRSVSREAVAEARPAAAPQPAPAPRESEPVQIAAAPPLTPSSSYGDPRWFTDTPAADSYGATTFYPSAPMRAGPPAQYRPSAYNGAVATPGAQLAQLGGPRPVPLIQGEPAAMPRTPIVRRPTPGFQTPEVQTASVSSMPASGHSAADALFGEAYRYEQAGQPQQAMALYDQLLATYPSAPSAMLANARLNYLRGGGGRTQVAAAQQGSMMDAGQRQVVPVNAPSPGNTLRPASLNPSLVADSPALYRTVCTRRDMYENNSGWCGIVTTVEQEAFRVEVRRIHLRGFGTIGITRSTCTGNTFMNWFSRGTVVRVPQACMTFQG